MRAISDVPVMFLTSRTAEMDVVRGLELGADGYLKKPISPTTVSAHVNAIHSYRVHRTVEVHGQVHYPGLYPIQKEKTRLKDLLEMAGGLTEDAFLPGMSGTSSEQVIIIISTRREDLTLGRENHR
jgi:DNA-binding NarL/FixJ family response regulator